MTAAEQGPAKPSRITPLPVRAWIDVAVLTALATIGILGFAPSFTDSRYLIAGLGGLAVGTIAGVVASFLRLGAVTTALAAVGLYFLLGSAFAMPAQALAGFLPTGETLAGMAIGAVFGWADIVTLTTPVAAPDYIGVLPYVAAWLVGLISSTIAGRWFATRRRSAASSAVALIAPVAVYVTSVLTGTDEPYLAGLRGVAFAVIALVWMAWRVPENANATSATRVAVLRQKLVGVAIIIAVAVVGGTVLGAAAAPSEDDRFVLREQIEPPFDPLVYPSPLSGFRSYLAVGLKDEVLFTVQGLEAGDRIRIATMDAYDGTLWNVTGPELATDGSGTFRLVSHDLPAVPLLTEERDVDATVTVGAYRDVWVPTVGYPDTIAFDPSTPIGSAALRFNPATGIAVDMERLAEGDVYTFSAVTQAQKAPKLAGAAVATVSQSPAQNVPDFIGAKATEWAAGAETPFAILTNIESAFRLGYLSHGWANQAPSSAGHGADRMRRLLDGKETMVGDQEQYASAFALMARYLGYPSRVVLGFSPEITGGGPVDVVGEDVDAWVEVAFEGIGWVSFDPTPTQTVVPDSQTQKPKSKPQPLVRQPPRSDSKHDDLVSAVEIEDEDDQARFVIPRWVWTLLTIVGIPLALYFIPFLIVAAVKRRRRRRRRIEGTGDRRAGGAWDELTDTYAELGYQAPRDATRIQLALLFEQQFRDELVVRGRERVDAERRAENRRVRAEAAAAAKAARAENPATASRPDLGSLLEATVLRAKDASTWRPGVTGDNDPLPAIPGLREFAVATDQAVFSGAEVDDATVDALWGQADEAREAARRSVSWFRRRLSAFRVRSHTSVATLVARLNAVMPRNPRKTVSI